MTEARCTPCRNTFTIHVHRDDGSVDCPFCKRRYWRDNKYGDCPEGEPVFALSITVRPD